jgi:dihydrofolate reductase
MAKLRVHSLAVSLDGYAAGLGQDAEHPMGHGGELLHPWVFATAYGQRMIGGEGGSRGVDDEWLRRGDVGIGATIMGRNMFGPIRGGWDTPEGLAWSGWWGPTPPYGHPVFVLTHHPRDPLSMDGGTVFNFVTGGIEDALEQAVAAAGGLDVRLGGGASAVQQYLRAGLVDELHVATVPVLLGAGERFFDKLDGGPRGMELAEFAASDRVAHSRFIRTP